MAAIMIESHTVRVTEDKEHGCLRICELIVAKVVWTHRERFDLPKKLRKFLCVGLSRLYSASIGVPLNTSNVTFGQKSLASLTSLHCESALNANNFAHLYWMPNRALYGDAAAQAVNRRCHVGISRKSSSPATSSARFSKDRSRWIRPSAHVPAFRWRSPSAFLPAHGQTHPNHLRSP